MPAAHAQAREVLSIAFALERAKRPRVLGLLELRRLELLRLPVELGELAAQALDRRPPRLGVLGQRRELRLRVRNLGDETLAHCEQRRPLLNLALELLAKRDKVALTREDSQLPPACFGLAVFNYHALLEHGVRTDEHEQQHDAAEPRRDRVEERHRE